MAEHGNVLALAARCMVSLQTSLTNGPPSNSSHATDRCRTQTVDPIANCVLGASPTSLVRKDVQASMLRITLHTHIQGQLAKEQTTRCTRLKHHLFALLSEGLT